MATCPYPYLSVMSIYLYSKASGFELLEDLLLLIPHSVVGGVVTVLVVKKVGRGGLGPQKTSALTRNLAPNPQP